MKKRIFIVQTFMLCSLCACSLGREMKDAGNINLDSENTIQSTDHSSQEDSVLRKIEECINNYSDDVSTIKKAEYEHLVMKETEFVRCPDFESVGVYIIRTPDISVEESIEVIKNWLGQNGFSVDLNHELYAATFDIAGTDEDSYPLVMSHIDEFTDGNYFFVNTNECQIQMIGANIYSMSNGVISAYVNSGKHAGLDAMGVYSENIVDEGFVDVMSDKSYELLNGSVSIGDAAKKIKEYFEKGTPYLAPIGIEVDVPYVRVFEIGDIYGYQFNVRRIYKGVPFAFGDWGSYREINSEQRIDFDTKYAYTITGNVDAYAGYSNNSVFEPIIDNQEAIVPLTKACEILDDFVGEQMRISVQRVAFEYCGIENYELNTITEYPCWSFEGRNSADGRIYVFYVNAVNGDVFFHSYVPEK